MINELTYQEDCYIGAQNTIERLLCGQNSQQTQFYKAIFIGILVIFFGCVIFVIKKKLLKKK